MDVSTWPVCLSLRSPHILFSTSSIGLSSLQKKCHVYIRRTRPNYRPLDLLHDFHECVVKALSPHGQSVIAISRQSLLHYFNRSIPATKNASCLDDQGGLGYRLDRPSSVHCFALREGVAGALSWHGQFVMRSLDSPFSINSVGLSSLQKKRHV